METKVIRQVSLLTSLKCQNILPAFGKPTQHGIKRSEFQTGSAMFAVRLWTDILTSVNLSLLGHKLQIECLSYVPHRISVDATMHETLCQLLSISEG